MLSKEECRLAYEVLMCGCNTQETYEKSCDIIEQLIKEHFEPQQLEKIVVNDEEHYVCPRCHAEVNNLLDKYCSNCGQALKMWI